MKLKEVIIKWLDKKACHHKWKLINETHMLNSPTDEIPKGISKTYVCANCGKFTTIKV